MWGKGRGGHNTSVEGGGEKSSISGYYKVKRKGGGGERELN